MRDFIKNWPRHLSATLSPSSAHAQIIDVALLVSNLIKKRIIAIVARKMISRDSVAPPPPRGRGEGPSGKTKQSWEKNSTFTHAIPACRSILARIVRTFVHLLLAECAVPTSFAHTIPLKQTVHALTAIQTGIRLAQIILGWKRRKLNYWKLILKKANQCGRRDIMGTTLIWQRFPLNPWGHSHSKSLIRSWHLAPNAHGLSAQSSEKSHKFIGKDFSYFIDCILIYLLIHSFKLFVLLYTF